MPTPLPSATARQLEVFLTMMLSRNLGEAADKLGISQPAVSKTLKALERDTGSTLFRKANGRLVPTPDAAQLLPYVQQALRQLDMARQIASGLRGGKAGDIVVAGGGPAVVSILPVAIARFRAERPETRIEMQIAATREVIEKVANHEAEFGVATPPARAIDARLLQHCVVRDLCETSLVVAMPADHPLARRSHIRASDLTNQDIVGLPSESATSDLVAAAFQQARIALRTPITASNAMGVCSLVQQGLGIGLINPLMLTQGAFSSLITRPFRPRIVLRTCLYVARLNKPSSAGARLIEHVRRAARGAAFASGK